MFRSRFNEAFPRGSPSVGPQDVEIGVVDGAPSAEIEGLLCGLLGLVLNRKKPVESVLPLVPETNKEVVSPSGIGAYKMGIRLTLPLFVGRVTMAELSKKPSKHRNRNGPRNGQQTPSVAAGISTTWMR
jgi:hypothetical protein